MRGTYWAGGGKRGAVCYEANIMLLEIVERKIGAEITVVALNGKLALGLESQRVEALVEELIERGAKRVIFDLSGVNYIDSAGVGMLALVTGRMKEMGGSGAVVAPEGKVLQLLTRTQMTSIMQVCATVEEAVETV
jgi:anti-sigma B factor antagonist